MPTDINNDNLFLKSLNTKEFKDTKWVIRIIKSKKNRQHNGQKKKDKGQTKNYKTYTHS